MIPRRVYHGTTAHLAPVIASDGLTPRHGYVHLASTEGLAWAYGAWSAGLVAANGIGSALPLQIALTPVGQAAAGALAKAPASAVAVIDATGLPLVSDPNAACPRLPWESAPRSAPCWRTREPIPADRIIEWRLWAVPELNDADTRDRLAGRADALGREYPRGPALLEDLTPEPVGDAIPNGRRLVAAILDAAGPAADLGWHGPPHWTRVAALGLEVAPDDADSTVVMLFALLHDAARRKDGYDPQHGPRAAELARRLNGDTFRLDADRLDRLVYACAHHTGGETTTDPTIGACWDADRLDIGRYGQKPDAAYLSTPHARHRIQLPIEARSVPLADVLHDYAHRTEIAHA